MRRYVQILVIVGLLISTAACGSPGNSGAPPDSPGVGTVDPSRSTFTAVRAQVFQTKCFSCHGNGRSTGGINLESYDSLMSAASTHGHAIIEPGNPDASHLYVSLSSGEMPPNGPKLTDTELSLIRDWISNGAKNN